MSEKEEIIQCLESMIEMTIIPNNEDAVVCLGNHSYGIIKDILIDGKFKDVKVKTIDNPPTKEYALLTSKHHK